LSEAVYRPLTGGGSVHLTDWPDPTALAGDPELVASMDRVRDACSAASAVRKANGRRVRLPLASLTVASSDSARLRPFADLIADEVNVREVRFGDLAELGEEVFQVDLPVVGPRLGRSTPAVVAAMKSGSYEYDAAADVLRVLDFEFGPGEFSRKVVPLDPVSTAPFGTHGLVSLDLEVTPELESEGVARDIARLVNQVRRDEALRIADRIELVVDVRGHDDVHRSIDEHAGFLAEETLATSVDVVDGGPDGGPDAGGTHVLELADGRAVGITVRATGPLRG
jgi:isoleucyl-tRNA synthetase